MDMSHRDAVEGGLLGVAAGDALGATVEFMSPQEINQRHGVHTDIVGGGAFDWAPGQGTDDTALTWAVVSGYLESDSGDHIAHIARAFLAWYESDPKDIGNTTGSALARLYRDRDRSSSGMMGKWSRGNGSLMRALPTALIRVDASVRMAESASISSVTHAEAHCVDSCVAYNEIAAALLMGAVPAEAISHARSLDLHPDVLAGLAVPASRDVTELCTDGYVISGLRCAVWAIQQNESLEEVLVALVNRGGDADMIGAIAGGLLGILHGSSSIPERWTSRLEYGPRFREATGRIEAMRASQLDRGDPF